MSPSGGVCLMTPLGTGGKSLKLSLITPFRFRFLKISQFCIWSWLVKSWKFFSELCGDVWFFGNVVENVGQCRGGSVTSSYDDKTSISPKPSGLNVNINARVLMLTLGVIFTLDHWRKGLDVLSRPRSTKSWYPASLARTSRESINNSLFSE